MVILRAALSTSLVFAFGCKSREFNDSRPQEQARRHHSKANSPAFCKASKSNDFPWNAERVQMEIRNLIGRPGYKSGGLSVYAEVYQAMTAERDKARCSSSGPMVPPSLLSERLNDALADIMTKGYVLSQPYCLHSFASQTASVPTIGQQMCDVSRQAIVEQWSGLELAMASTATYLTSVMGIALSVLPHVERLWQNEVHHTLEQRIAALEEFKPTFDAFNLFLSNNLHTVARVLVREKYVDCKLFELTARGAELTRAPALIFKDIRDKTFVLGASLASSWPKGLHPLVTGTPDWNVERIFPPFASEPDPLMQLRSHAKNSISILKNPLLKIFDGKDAATFVAFEGFTCPIEK